MNEKKLKIECQPPPGSTRPPQMMLSKGVWFTPEGPVHWPTPERNHLHHGL